MGRVFEAHPSKQDSFVGGGGPRRLGPPYEFGRFLSDGLLNGGLAAHDGPRSEETGTHTMVSRFESVGLRGGSQGLRPSNSLHLDVLAEFPAPTDRPPLPPPLGPSPL